MSSTRQATLGGRYEVVDGKPGDLLERTGSGRSVTVALSECPLCATDPTRPRHHFTGGNDGRVAHFVERHGPEDV